MKKSNLNEIMVSIVCLTYNHEDYIRNALDGFLEQQVDFSYEIIIHDDASTDRTVEIIEEHEISHTDVVRIICQRENQYSQKGNFSFLSSVYALCNGKYIAFCEGDDFWIDTHKLQLQVDFLEEHPDYVLTAHNAVRLWYSEKKVDVMNPYSQDRTIKPEEIIMQYNGNIPTASIVVRSGVLKKMDKLFWECDIGDWSYQLFCIRKGKIYYFDRIMSLYRFAHEGGWTINWEKDFDETFEHCIKMISFLTRYREYTGHQYNKYIITKIQIYASSILGMLTKQRQSFFEKKCKEYDRKTKGVYHSYIKELKRVYMQTFDETYYDQKLKCFVEKNKHILLFGAGDYAGRVARQLKNYQVNFDGFLVSNINGPGKEYLGKPVWGFKKIPFHKGTVGVIVSIKPVMWNQLEEVLEENGIKEYICPFLFDV